MGKYDHLSKDELIRRIEKLEADLENTTLTPSVQECESEIRQSQHTYSAECDRRFCSSCDGNE